MRPYLLPILVGLGVALLGAAIGQTAIVMLGLILGVLAVAFTAMKSAQALREDDPAEELGPESRILLRPLKMLYQEMQDAAEGKSESISPYIAQEALQESKQLLEQSAAALRLRDRLLKESRSGYSAQKSAEDLEARLATAASEDERTSLQSALDARKQELGHYSTLEQGIAKIESSVKQAEAAMAEMRAKLISSGAAGLAQQGSDPLRETVGRMRALSTSLTEAQEMLQQ